MEKKMIAITEAIDAMSKTAKILDFLSRECNDAGLCFILDACVEDLVRAGINLEVAVMNTDIPGEEKE